MLLTSSLKQNRMAKLKIWMKKHLLVSFTAVYLLQPWIPYPFTGWTARHWGLSIPWMIEVFKEPSKCATLICVSSNSELIQYKLRDIQSTARPLILWVSAKRESSSFDFLSGLLSVLEKKKNNLFYSLLTILCNILFRWIS